ncbi:MAG: DUF1211 domain-containing protein [Xanthomonadales bacterium]|nr:DUF1211 domain-containing protein [Gammaproteobacteria bacterium]MBT8074382.1 DUF1211 domain-containing protein [Gammaproteobacteria bacterium]NNK05234.1 DUF1211 domain-containing protein [Xanthomonadales bacterium]NNK97837.1 DUF1211 domain-containing protein [Xanthomonadales bacterium]
MTPLTQKFVDSCPVENGFRMRGLEMTRLEVFIDAAFAFAVTMLVISFDNIPRSYEEVILAIKSIPAFIVAVAQLVWIWHAHNMWSRRFGLDTAYTVFISTALLIVVLIYVYPMRIMAAGMFAWFTSDYLPSNFASITLDELRDMFVFLGLGFIALCLVFVQMYRYAARLKVELLLNEYEHFESQTLAIMWTGAAGIGLISVVLAITLPSPLVPYSGFAFSLLGAWFPFVRLWRHRSAPGRSL